MTSKYSIFLSLDEDRFRECLSESNWPVRHLAMAVGSSERTLYRAMSDGKIPISLALSVCMTLGSDVEDVFGRQDPELMDVLRNVIFS